MLKELFNSNRFKSLLWRAAMMAIAIFLSVVADGLTGIEVGGEATVLLGLIMGEISKAINNQYGR